nr:MAG TPA: hypothetical protein [Bacteriophage sp.]
MPFFSCISVAFVDVRLLQHFFFSHQINFHFHLYSNIY